MAHNDYRDGVETLVCGHVAYPASSRVCPHLVEYDEDIEHVRLLTGHRVDYDLACAACDAAGQPVSFAVVCEGCAGRLNEDAEDGNFVGWRGKPGVEERPEPVDTTVREWRLPTFHRKIIGLAPGVGDKWLALTAGGKILALDPGEQSSTVVAAKTLIAEPDHEPFMHKPLTPRLHASPCGRFAAVVNDYGRYGRVVDLQRGGATTMMLDSGTSRTNTVPFSLVFARHDDRTVLVHRTEWNRIDVHDAETGRLLTDRAYEKVPEGQRPPHYLDYFHGRMHLSPDGRWLVNDGWVWAPVGIPESWNLEDWLRRNVWEAEDGPSRRRLAYRHYHWDAPMCFVSDTMMAIGGIGPDDVLLLDGVQLVNVVTGEEAGVFAGPTGQFFADRTRLYAAAAGGLEIWDPVTGHRTGSVPGFVPTCHHRAAGQFAEVRDGVLRRWSTA